MSELRRFRLRAFLNTQTRVVHLSLDGPGNAPSNEYPERFSLCGKVLAALADAPEDEETLARRDQLHRAIAIGRLPAAISGLYPHVASEEVDQVLLRIESLVDATLARPERRSWGMLDLGPASAEMVPRLDGAKLCGACERSPYARELR